MASVLDTLVDQIIVDFDRACAELAEARLRQQEKDSRANREAVAEWHARIDLVLDRFRETGATTAGAASGAQRDNVPLTSARRVTGPTMPSTTTSG